ncbi:NAD(P)/FAD-dependent oxidoreductase [bacterium]|nr:MAG: NAD(P)/FAD-dependent oxidoreductase [bacterium]
MYDIIVIGGSFAGQAAALQIARARRQVLVIDTKKPRNRFASASHGFLGHDGLPPAAIMLKAREQLLAYPTARFTESEVISAVATRDGFSIALANGEQHQAKRLILATGVADILPDIPGLKERWGETVLHCPYCHGYEFGGRQLGVIATSPMALHQAMLIPDWGPTTFFTNDSIQLDAEKTNELKNRGVVIEDCPVQSLVGEGEQLDGVLLTDGRFIEIAAVFIGPQNRMTNPLAEQLGCAFEDGPLGPALKVDEFQKTTVPGVFAAGDSSSFKHNATFAAASGVMAGVAAHRSLFML